MPPTAFLIEWGITWVILSVVFWVLTDSLQRYLYESSVEKIGWRVMAVTPLLAAVLVRWPLPFENLFFNLFSTLGQGLLWFITCWLAMRFQWQHAAAAGLIAIVTIAPVTSSSVASLSARIAPETSARSSPVAPKVSPTPTPAADQQPPPG